MAPEHRRCGAGRDSHSFESCGADVGLSVVTDRMRWSAHAFAENGRFTRAFTLVGVGGALERRQIRHLFHGRAPRSGSIEHELRIHRSDSAGKES